MRKGTYTGMNDAKGKKLYNGDFISFQYEDKIEESGFATVVGEIVYENAAFVVKEVNFDGYDWTNDGTRPMLLWEWLTGDKCYKINPVSSIQNPVS